MLAFVVAGAALFVPVVAGRHAIKVLTAGIFLSREVKKKRAEDKNKEDARLFRLGINPARMEYAKKSKMKALVDMKKLAKEMGDVSKILPKTGIQPFEKFHRFNLTKKDLSPKLHWLCGKYLLTEEERREQGAGIRALELLHKEGDAAEKLLAFCEKYSVNYRELAFLWSGTKVDFEWLRQLSKERMKDEAFLQHSGQAKRA